MSRALGNEGQQLADPELNNETMTTSSNDTDSNHVILCAFLDIAHVLHALEIDNDPGSINIKALRDTLSDLQEAHPKTLEHPYLEAKTKAQEERIYCHRCDSLLNPDKAVWLELNSRTGEWRDGMAVTEDDNPSWGDESQGGFSFGAACAKAQLAE